MGVACSGSIRMKLRTRLALFLGASLFLRSVGVQAIFFEPLQEMLPC